MGISISRVGRVGRPTRSAVGGWVLVLASCLALGGGMGHAVAGEPERPAPGETSFGFPTVRPEHRHVRELLANALRYLAPESHMIDPASGYPFEGWNQDPARGLYLRSFTQLTAIGQCLELFANVAAGNADTPYLTRDQALADLTRLVKSLRQDQQDPRLSAHRLLGNFLDLATGMRRGPLASEVATHTVLDAFGPERGAALWEALQAKGWIVPQNHGREGAIRRSAQYGWAHFDGPLAPFSDHATRQRVMDLLDQRVVLIVFIDNANLSASVAKSIGALLGPGIKDQPGVADLRRDLEAFLDGQREGYARLYDTKAGQFYFGWDATKDRLFGWEDRDGNWVTGHVDYLVNEFRSPATFIVTRFGLPWDPIASLGFTMKPYRMRDGRDVYVLAPWEGSAFQALGLGLSMTELDRPSWRTLLENVVAVEIDYATRHHLPGFLSESYSGDGVQYTGRVGIPDIAVSPLPRITDAASLYTLGAAYTVAPAQVEQFLAANWPAVSTLLTAHGPWEGLKVSRQEVIRFQTSAHTFALILGLLGTESTHMRRYLDSQGLGARLEAVFRPGRSVDLLSGETQVFAWNDPGDPIRSARENGTFHVSGARVSNAGLAFVPAGAQGVNLSGGLLSLHYRSTIPMTPALIALKPTGSTPAGARLIPTEIVTHFAATGGRKAALQVPLPATPGLLQTKEVVITFGPESNGRPIDLSITRFCLTPLRGAPPAEGGERPGSRAWGNLRPPCGAPPLPYPPRSIRTSTVGPSASGAVSSAGRLGRY